MSPSKPERLRSVSLLLIGLLACGGAGPVLAADDDRASNAAGVPLDVSRVVATHLHESGSPWLADARILAQVRQGFLYPEEGLRARDLLAELQAKGYYEQVKFIAAKLVSHWTAEEHNRYWLAQAGELLRREQFDDAVLALQFLRKPIDPSIEERRESMLGLLRLQQSKLPEAVAALERRQGFPFDRRADHFNFGVSLVEHGRRLEGLALLDELAETRPQNAEDQAVSDRANMALGWMWMREKQGATARATFKRVSLKGPYSNLALLGLGWSEWLPDGEVQRIQFRRELSCGDIRNAPEDTRLLLFNSYHRCKSKQKKTFTYARQFAHEPGGSEKQRKEKALVWWDELNRRDVSDPAVQESLLAAAYTRANLGQVGAAIEGYKTAISRYDAEVARLDGLTSAVQQQQGSIETLLAQPPHEAQFARLRSSRAYAQRVLDLKSLEQAAQLTDETRAWLTLQRAVDSQRRVQVGYVRGEWLRQEAVIAERRQAVNAELAGLVTTEIGKIRERLDRYRAEAVLALARLYDRQATQ